MILSQQSFPRMYIKIKTPLLILIILKIIVIKLIVLIYQKIHLKYQTIQIVTVIIYHLLYYL